MRQDPNVITSIHRKEFDSFVNEVSKVFGFPKWFTRWLLKIALKRAGVINKEDFVFSVKFQREW